jgi:hypothetical protein
VTSTKYLVTPFPPLTVLLMSEMHPSKRCECARVLFDLPQRRMFSVVAGDR